MQVSSSGMFTPDVETFKAMPAHVVLCMNGGYGVMTFTRRGTERIGYQVGKRGTLTREQAENIAKTKTW